MVDDELPPARRPALRDHVAGCESCARYDRQLRAVRTRLRIEPVEHVVDLVPRVLADVDERVPRRPVRVRSLVAAFVAAFVAGAAFVGLAGGPDPVGARDLSDAVLRAQRTVESLRAELTIVERGWHAAVPERRFEGSLVYRAPESLALRLRDRTSYPSDEWVPDDVDLVVDGGVSWESAVIRCPRDALPGCTPRTPRVRALLGRDPFPDTGPAPLDLVVPVGSFARSGDVEDLGADRVDGRDVVGVRVSVAQAEPLLGGLLSLGNARALHPTDVVDLWLDRDALVPVALDVYAAGTAERAEWAARRGFDDGDEAILSVRWNDIRLDGPIGDEMFPPPPATAAARDTGFTPGGTNGPLPAWVPPGMALVRDGIVRVPGGPAVEVRAWSDGRAWVKVATTSEWGGGRLFGDLGPIVRRVTVGAGTGYVDERGARVAVHGEGADAVVTGSLATEDLVRVAAGLGITGRQVPADWNEAATVDVGELRDASILLARDHGEPAVRREGETVTLSYSGPGPTGFLVVQAPGSRLGPPFDPDARAVDVRDARGRWSPQLGTLEWVERGRVVSISSRTLGLGDLVAIAGELAAP